MGGGEVNASIDGCNNLSLQNWTNSTVPTSITFSGDNTHYTGTLYLHPSINSIIFNSQDSIINNINFPKSDDGSTRKVNIIFKDSNNNTNINELTISDNLNINVQGIINLKKLHLSNTSSLKTLHNSNINIIGNTGPSINISSDNYNIKTMLIDKIVAYFDYGSGKNGQCLYYYPDKVHCNNTITDADGNSTTCNNLLSIKQVDSSTTQPNTTDIINNLYSTTCSNCKKNPIINEPVLQSYLYPKEIYNSSTEVHLYCSICRDEKYSNGGYLQYYQYTIENDTFTDLTLIDNCLNDHKNCIITDPNNLIYNKDYVLEQLNIAHIKGILTVKKEPDEEIDPEGDDPDDDYPDDGA